EAKGHKLIIFKENPLFDYFSDDERASAVIIKDGKIDLIGDTEVSQNFNEMVANDYCIVEPYFSFRKGNACPQEMEGWFQFPLADERRFMTGQKKNIGQIIDAIAQEMKVDDTERSISEHIRNDLCAAGYSLYYEPVVAFDQNTLNIWNRPGESNLKKVMYIEVAAKKNGLTLLYSNSFLATGEDAYVNKYRESIEAAEVVKNLFIEGNSTSMLSTKLQKYRNSKLYLTTPLYPFNYHPIPGEDAIVKTGDVAVFDLWASTTEFSFRRKIVAVAGSYRASII
ncbi:MAG: hypothetical protein QXU18_15030, partial [Thermoplasmatales archaeon]